MCKFGPLSFAPCLTHLFFPPCTDPSTQPHIQESDTQVTCRLNFWYYYYPFVVFALWNVVLSRPFSPRSWLDPPNLSRCVRLCLNICSCSLPVLMCPLTNNWVDPLPWLSWSELPYWYDILTAIVLPRGGSSTVHIWYIWYMIRYMIWYIVNCNCVATRWK